MIIFSNNLKRLFKQKGLLIIMLMPIVFTAFFLMGSSDLTYEVGLIDLDQTQSSEWISKGIDENGSIINLESMTREAIDEAILLSDYDLIVVIPAGFETSLLGDQDQDVYMYYSMGNSLAQIPKSSLSSRIEKLKALSQVVDSPQALAQAFEASSDGVLDLTSRRLGDTNKARSITASGVGILVMSMMLFAHSSGAKVNDDRGNGIFSRIMAGPMNRRQYNLQVLLSLFVMVAINVAGVILVLSTFLGADFGPNPWNVFAVLLVFATVAVAITTLINNLSKDRHQANVISIMVTTPLCMLGGCFWPIEITPKFMQYIANFVPTKWIMDAVNKTISGASLTSVSVELVILLLFTVTIFALASSKKIASQN